MYLPRPEDFDKYWVIDIETDGLWPTLVWVMCVQNVATGAEFKYVGHEAIKRFFKKFPEDHWLVAHNGLSYDVYHLNRLLGLGIDFGRVVDTLVLSYLYHPHLPGGHSLESYGERFKYPKGDYNDWSKYTPEMLAYCQQDVRLTRRVFVNLVERLQRIGFSELSCWIEHRIRLVIDKQERTGFYFDLPKAQKFQRRLRALEQRLGAYITETVFPPRLVAIASYKYKTKADGQPFQTYLNHEAKYPKITFNGDGTYTVWDWQSFNIGSPKQRAERLLELGWKPKTFTPTGQPKVDEESLLDFAKASKIPEVGAISRWLVVNARGNMVTTWINAVNKDTQAIHGTVFSCGAITRRMRHNSPNTANIPGNEARLGRVCRSLWRARPGRVLVGYDAAALEMRMFGHYLNNKEAADLYINGDPHTANTDALLAACGDVFTRRTVKTDFYAFLYGASNKKLASQYGKSAQFGKKMRETLLVNTPGLADLVEKIQAEAETGFVETVDGGYVRVLAEHAALNSKLQSAGGIAMKLCSVLLDEKITELGLDVLKVGDIHDEGQLDCAPEHAELAGRLAVQCLIAAGEMLGLTVPLDGEFKIGNNWAETH